MPPFARAAFLFRLAALIPFTLGFVDTLSAQSAETKGPWSPPTWESSDGSAALELEGLFQVHATSFASGRDPGLGFHLQRMRPELAGHLAHRLRFRVEPNFSEEGVELEEAWIGLDVLDGDALFMAGRMKVPFGLEEVRSRRHINFTQFSILNQFSPAEEQGLFLNGASSSGRLEYGLALTNGGGGENTDDRLDLAVRAMVHPFSSEPASVLHNLQIGLAVSLGSSSDSLAGTSVTNAAGQDVIQMDPAARSAGDQLSLGMELAWFRGPWFLQAELLGRRSQMEGSVGAADVDVAGAYLELAHVLTGESKTFGGVIPDQPLGRGSGRGAWVLAGRYSHLRAGAAMENLGIAEADTFTRGIESVSLGLNWVLNQHAIMRHSYVYSSYSDGVLVGGNLSRGEGAILVGLQLHF